MSAIKLHELNWPTVCLWAQGTEALGLTLRLADGAHNGHN